MHRLLTLLAVAAIAAAGADAAVLQGGIEPSYPPAPRAVGGGDPFKGQTQPQECARARARPKGRGYFALRNLRTIQGESPFVSGAVSTTILRLVNVKKQEFRLYISGATAAAVKRFISTAEACLERFPLKKAVPKLIDPVQFDVILVQAALDETGLDEDDLVAARDKLAQSGPVSLVDVVADQGVDPEVVILDATVAADDALQAKVAAGELTAAEVAALDLEAIMRELAEQSGAPFLYSHAALPVSPAQLGGELKKDPRGSIVMGMQPIGTQKNAAEIVWFAVDPPIDAGVTHNFIAKCQKISAASIVSNAGSETLTFWRVATPVVGSRTASLPSNPAPSGMTHTSTTSRTYDIKVVGNKNGSNYYVGGNWVRGGGGGC